MSEAVAGDEAVKIVSFQAETGEVIPATHVLAGSRQTRDLAENLQQSIVVQVQETGMVLLELTL